MMEFLPMVLTAIAIGIVVEIVKKLAHAEAGDPGIKGVVFVTYKAHGLAVGAVVGLVGSYFGIPVPAVFGTEIGGAVLCYVCSGAIAMVAYSALVGVLKNSIKHFFGPIR